LPESAVFTIRPLAEFGGFTVRDGAHMHLSRSDLLARGWSDGRIARAVRDGRLTRIRAGHFVDGPIDEMTARAIRIGGRLACVSELRYRGVWVLDSQDAHVHLASNAARWRSDPVGARRHWQPLFAGAEADHVSLVDALVQARRCLRVPEWIASVDSALHLGRLNVRDLALLRASVPRVGRRALDHIDGSAESGLESIVRLLAVLLGFRVRSQVELIGVGRVDLIIEDWIAVEIDGTKFHDDALAPRDRRRDAQLEATGRAVLRPGYELVVHDPGLVARQLIGAVEAHRRVQDSGRIVRRARSRLVKLDLA
jgi:very-short-patch-repair endonuclease